MTEEELEDRLQQLEEHMLTVMSSLIQAGLLKRPARDMKDSTDWPKEN